MKVINLFAGPGAGKSTAAAGLFALMKSEGRKVELVTEYAKDLHYGKDWQRLGCQLVVTAEQYFRVYRLQDEVDWVITDSPIALGVIYAKTSWERAAALEAFRQFHNESFFINRVKPYAPYGRRHSEDSARVIDKQVRDMLMNRRVRYKGIDGDVDAPRNIYKALFL